MKKIVILPLFFAACLQIGAQNERYIKSMEAALESMDTAKTLEAMLPVANRFERIGNAEKTAWLPFYYAALSYTTMTYLIQDNVKKDEYLDKAQELIEKAGEIKPEESEIYTVQGMIYGTRIGVDPMVRSQEFGPKSGMALQKALQLNPENPRANYMLGQNLLFTPPAFGGGKDKGMPLLKKSLELFEKEEPESSIHPKWGREQAEQVIKWVEKGMPVPGQEEGSASPEEE